MEKEETPRGSICGQFSTSNKKGKRYVPRSKKNAQRPSADKKSPDEAEQHSATEQGNNETKILAHEFEHGFSLYLTPEVQNDTAQYANVSP